jgi:3-hydroxyisobutyrate dehydrogenase
MPGCVAVLGAGIMGAPMARNLLGAGFQVRVWNRSAAKAQALAGDGAGAADTPAAAVHEAGLVLTVLADGEAVQEVMRDAAPAMPEGSVWLQMSTVGEKATEALARLAAEHGIAFVDAPVVGTKQPAEEGKLVILASGPGDALDRAQPVFDAVGSKTLRLGEAGAGSRMKLVTNSWIVGLVEALAETISLAESVGVEPAKFLEVIDGGPLSPVYAQVKGKMMVERDFPTSFPLKHSLKDARLVLDAAEGTGVELPVIEAVARQMERAAKAGHADEDMAATIYASAPRQ